METLFEMYRGDDYVMPVTFKDALDFPIDITGWAFKVTMKLATEFTDDAAEVQVDVPAVSGTDATNGLLNVLLPKEQTQNLLPTDYYIDLQKEVNGSVQTVFAGIVVVKPDVTRRIG